VFVVEIALLSVSERTAFAEMWLNSLVSARTLGGEEFRGTLGASFYAAAESGEPVVVVDPDPLDDSALRRLAEDCRAVSERVGHVAEHDAVIAAIASGLAAEQKDRFAAADDVMSYLAETYDRRGGHRS
jgi:transketolase C-terminal domain/subunit